MTTQLLFIHALSPLHAGTGTSNGAIELAIARERGTNYPYLPGSSLKGSLRDRAHQEARDVEVALFGPPTENASDHMGALIFGDANLLLFPVRSIAGTFAWVTSPYLLHRFARDAREVGLELPKLPPSPKEVERCYVGDESILTVDRDGGDVIFEDLDFRAQARPEVAKLAVWLGEQVFPEGSVSDAGAWRTMLGKRLCVVHDDAMGFLSQHATDVVTRIALENDTKTVRKGALWHEENLPTETFLVSLIDVPPKSYGAAKMDAGQMKRALADLTARPLQLGGHATVGRGRCRLVLSSAGKGGAK